MKRIINISVTLTVLMAIFVLQACKKEDRPSKVVPLSYPQIDSGAVPFIYAGYYLLPAISIPRGGTFTDPGCFWHDTSTGEYNQVVKQTISNTSQDTAILLTYTITNKNGLQVTAYRYVGITNISAAYDISGGYNDANGGTETVAKLATGVFSNTNMDALGAGDYGFFVIKGDSTMSVTTQYFNVTGADLPFVFSNPQISYQPAFAYTGTPPRLTAQPAVSFSYSISIKNVTQLTASFQQNLQ